MLGLLDRATQLTNLKRDTPCPQAADVRGGIKDDRAAAPLLFAHGHSTERTVRLVSRRQAAGMSELNPT